MYLQNVFKLPENVKLQNKINVTRDKLAKDEIGNCFSYLELQIKFNRDVKFGRDVKTPSLVTDIDLSVFQFQDLDKTRIIELLGEVEVPQFTVSNKVGNYVRTYSWS